MGAAAVSDEATIARNIMIINTWKVRKRGRDEIAEL